MSDQIGLIWRGSRMLQDIRISTDSNICRRKKDRADSMFSLPGFSGEKKHGVIAMFSMMPQEVAAKA